MQIRQHRNLKEKSTNKYKKKEYFKNYYYKMQKLMYLKCKRSTLKQQNNLLKKTNKST